MKTYKIQVIEMSSRIIEIELEDEYDVGDAIAEVRSDYYNEEIVLDYTDFDYVDFEEVED
jgi:hypothetical protein